MAAVQVWQGISNGDTRCLLRSDTSGVFFFSFLAAIDLQHFRNKMTFTVMGLD